MNKDIIIIIIIMRKVKSKEKKGYKLKEMVHKKVWKWAFKKNALQSKISSFSESYAWLPFSSSYAATEKKRKRVGAKKEKGEPWKIIIVVKKFLINYRIDMKTRKRSVVVVGVVVFQPPKSKTKKVVDTITMM